MPDVMKTPEKAKKDDYQAKLDRLLDDGPDEAVEPVERTPCNGVFVAAVRAGTYPKRGDTYGVYRQPGEVFELNFLEDYASHRKGGWMRRVQPGEQIPQEVERQVPQTTSRVTGSANPFPPMQ